MTSQSEKKDVANKYSKVYARTADLFLGVMHRFLLSEIDKYLKQIKEDKVLFINKVWHFYGALFNKASRHFSHDQPFLHEVKEAVMDEFYNAKRELIEFYKSIKVIKKSMSRSHLKDVRRKMHKDSTFGSIIAKSA